MRLVKESEPTENQYFQQAYYALIFINCWCSPQQSHYSSYYNYVKLKVWKKAQKSVKCLRKKKGYSNKAKAAT